MDFLSSSFYKTRTSTQLRDAQKIIMVNCKEHSQSMELLALRIRIEKGISDPKELENTKKKIRQLEEELKLD